MAAVIVLGLLAAVVAGPSAAAKYPDPRICTTVKYATPAACGDGAAEIALLKWERKRSPGWDADVGCRALAGLLRYMCAWNTGPGTAWTNGPDAHGRILVTYNPATFAPTITPQ